MMAKMVEAAQVQEAEVEHDRGRERRDRGRERHDRDRGRGERR
jgi:hypothetical protein